MALNIIPANDIEVATRGRKSKFDEIAAEYATVDVGIRTDNWIEMNRLTNPNSLSGSKSRILEILESEHSDVFPKHEIDRLLWAVVPVPDGELDDDGKTVLSGLFVRRMSDDKAREKGLFVER